MSADQAQAAFGEPSAPKRASTLGYWLAGLVGLAAVAGAIAWFVLGFTGLGDRVDDLERVPIPGSAVVTLEQGKNAVYYEGRGDPSLQIRLRALDGIDVVVGPHGGDVTYDVNGHSGRSVAGFTLERSGDYELSVDGPRGVLAVGKGVGGRIVSAILGGLGIFFGGLLLCGVLIILTAATR